MGKPILHLPSSSFKKFDGSNSSNVVSSSGSNDGILSGLGMSLNGSVLTVAFGSWSIDFLTYKTVVDTVFNLDAADPVLYRVDV